MLKENLNSLHENQTEFSEQFNSRESKMTEFHKVAKVFRILVFTLALPLTTVADGNYRTISFIDQIQQKHFTSRSVRLRKH